MYYQIGEWKGASQPRRKFSPLFARWVWMSKQIANLDVFRVVFFFFPFQLFLIFDWALGPVGQPGRRKGTGISSNPPPHHLHLVNIPGSPAHQVRAKPTLAKAHLVAGLASTRLAQRTHLFFCEPRPAQATHCLHTARCASTSGHPNN